MKNEKKKITRKTIFEEANLGRICHWILSNPKEIKDDYYKHFKYSSVDSSYHFLQSTIFKNLVDEATYILEKNNYPTDPDDLLWEDETEMDLVSASAKQVLFLTMQLSALLKGCNDCKELIRSGNIKFWNQFIKKDPDMCQETFIYTTSLISAVINMGINPRQLFSDVASLKYKVKKMEPDHKTQEKHRRFLQNYRNERSKLVAKQHNKWLTMAKEIKAKHPDWKPRSIANDIRKKLRLPDKSLQTIYKFLLNNLH